MSRRAARARRPSPEVTQALADLARHLHAGLIAAARLADAHAAGGLDDEQREEARARAAGLAAVGRMGNVLLLDIADEAPPGLEPWAAYRAAAQLTFSLCALAQPDPGTLALLSRREVDELLERQGAADWLARIGEIVPLEDPC